MSRQKMHFKITDRVPWHLSVIFGLQHFLTMAGATLTIPTLVAGFVGMENIEDRARLISTVFLSAALTTLIQVSVGVRLPVVQGGSFSFIPPAMAIASSPMFEGASWRTKMLEINGAIMVASAMQIILGGSGLLGLLLRFVGPITIGPTVAMVGLALFQVAAEKAGGNPWVAALVCFVIFAFSQSQWLGRIKVRIAGVGLSPFSLLPVLLALLLTWFLCFILTVSDALPQGDPARTDDGEKARALASTPWIQLVWPFQWGIPTVSVASAIGMLGGVFAGMVESVGDYFASARLCDAPPPPPSAINRGILMEGIGCLIEGALGSGNGSTTYAENNGAVALSKVASRRVIVVASLWMIVLSLVGKVGGLLASIPDPVFGGMYLALFGIITGVGISQLQHVDLGSMRNVMIIGFSLLLGFVLPAFAKADAEGDRKMDTGNEAATQVGGVRGGGTGKGQRKEGRGGLILDS
uniref:Uncharacterized protein n=1 Tax=Chromera velia CCMP2878 TaxID=1169474 RepID=A0A0G4HXR0_9ALVE|eukprot:Cvel_33265.t1-p1 / transcript=Cvel_33265.t1 / gene=Cvel_33265 / organism=Chromera_velia_CCMP2878 / gene_product=Solute carrier family 23 member 1, putative / transcript_product=Solute carrier family 23 member 1, putative / location=Cvel_scaffold5359:179-4170(-) / protein_length=466 / sequence_SO=supercontig / SO=protein_coding / is_pseudo=false